MNVEFRRRLKIFGIAAVEVVAVIVWLVGAGMIDYANAVGRSPLAGRVVFGVGLGILVMSLLTFLVGELISWLAEPLRKPKKPINARPPKSGTATGLYEDGLAG